MTRSRTFWMLGGLLAAGVFAQGCRGCSPQPAPSANTEQPAAEPEAGPVEAPPQPEPVAEADAGPPAPTRPPPQNTPELLTGAAEALVQRVLTGTEPIASIQPNPETGLGANWGPAVGEYVRCRAVRDPSICSRLSDRERNKCSIAPSQAAARARSDRGWVVTDALLAECQSAHIAEPICRAFGTAIETSDANLCVGLPDPIVTLCRAFATNDASICRQVPRETTCAAEVQFYQQLRLGIPAFTAAPSEYYRPIATGLGESPRACEDMLRARTRELVTSAAAAGAAALAAAPAMVITDGAPPANPQPAQQPPPQPGHP